MTILSRKNARSKLMLWMVWTISISGWIGFSGNALSAVISVDQITTGAATVFDENTMGDSVTWTIISNSGVGNTVKITGIGSLVATKLTNDPDDLIDPASLRITADGCTGVVLANG